MHSFYHRYLRKVGHFRHMFISPFLSLTVRPLPLPCALLSNPLVRGCAHSRHGGIEDISLKHRGDLDTIIESHDFDNLPRSTTAVGFILDRRPHQPRVLHVVVGTVLPIDTLAAPVDRRPVTVGEDVLDDRHGQSHQHVPQRREHFVDVNLLALVAAGDRTAARDGPDEVIREGGGERGTKVVERHRRKK